MPTRKENPAPFETVIERFGPQVHGYLVARVGADRADDCFQETMVSALRAWDGAGGIRSVRAWLFTIAAAKAVDAHRARARQAVPAGAPGEDMDGMPGNPRAESPIEAVIEDPIWDEVRALPEKQQQAVTLRFRGDLTHREVGLVLGISEAAARRNAFEGIKALRERIGR